ncbi:DNA polymerase III subunit beta [bacterium]|nr:DNA polymerase III subunit beta [bacterium]RQV93297.1 MAG: DNA polymerase III subunit beta [bacterium]
MKFSILQNDLINALQIISGVVPTRSTTPILENILFDLENGILKITATDLEVSITTEVSPQEVDKHGSIALPAKVLTEMIRSLPEIPIHFNLDENNRMKITTDKGIYQIAGISKENFPEMPLLSNERTVEVSSAMLSRMFSKTIFAVSSEELRPALMGVFMQIMSDEFRMVSTDGHRLAKIADKSFRYDENPIQMIIPSKAVQIALKNLNGEDTIKLVIDDNGFRFNFPKTILYTRLVEGEYPDYERVIPRDNDKQLTVNRNLLVSSVRRVSLFSSVLTHQIRFSIKPDKLIVCSEDIDIGGEAREELDVEYKEEPMEIGYNAQYVLDILKQIDTEDVIFLLKSPVRATLVTPMTQGKEESFLMLIMPIKLGSS